MGGRVHFREALPPEKWCEMACFLALLRISAGKGRSSAAGAIQEWRERRRACLRSGGEPRGGVL